MPLKIVRSDITKMRVDAIVSSTDADMSGSGGADFAIREAAGKGLCEECRALAPLGVGEVRITGAYALPCKLIAHINAPVWRSEGDAAVLGRCYTHVLTLLIERGCESVALPLISSGTNGCPKDRALRIATEAIGELLLTSELDVYLCVYDRESYQFSKRLYNEIIEYIDEPYYLCESDFAVPAQSRMNRPVRPHGSKTMRIESVGEIGSLQGEELKAYLKSFDKSFAELLFKLIDERGMSDVECYKRANIDKRTFSKLKSRPRSYRPSKQTAVAFAIALGLSLEETQALLATAGLTLSECIVFDKIIRFFIERGVYDIFEINEALFEFDQPLLGSL